MPLYLNASTELISIQRQNPLPHNVGLFVGCVVGGIEGAGEGNVDGLGLGDGLGICDGDCDGIGVVGRRVGLGDGI